MLKTLKRLVSQSRTAVVTPVHGVPKEGPPRIDVVTPFSEADERFLPGSANSILMQVNVKPVLHLVADGFEPGPVARQLVELNPGRVKLYRNEENIGPYCSVMRVWDRMESDWYAVQDADDFSLPHRLQDAVHTLKERGAGLFGGAQEQGLDAGDMGDGDEFSLEHATGDSKNSPYQFSGELAFITAPKTLVLHPTFVCNREDFEGMNGYAGWRSGADCEFSTRAFMCPAFGVEVRPHLHVIRRLRAASLSHSFEFGKDRSYNEWLQREMVTRFASFNSGKVNWSRYGELNRYARDMHKTPIVAE